MGMKMKQAPLISVIVPVYNILEYLPRCVHSIMAQTYTNIEILLVDDGSTDGTERLCDMLALEDARIKVFHKENGGSSSARNLGITHAKGEYFGFIDSDDYIDADMYEKLYKALSTHQTLAAQIGRDEVDIDGNILPDICHPPEQEECIDSKDFLRELLMHRGDASFCTKLIHRNLFTKDRFPEGVLNEDFYLLVKILPRLKQIVSVPSQAYHVFYRVGSNTRKADKEDFSRVYGDCVDNADMVLKMVQRDYKDLLPEAIRFGVFQRLEYLLHIPISRMRKENRQYVECVKWIQKNWWKGMCNPYLTGKNKLYQTMFAVAPKGIRSLHKHIKRL